MKKLFILLMMLPLQFIHGEGWHKIIDLSGYWKFNIGDDKEWSEYYFDDEDWDEIKVPSSWEDQGYNGYNGYAWYRKEFEMTQNLKNLSLYVSLGYIDDVDEVYLNGKLIGTTGSFPPNFRTAYNALRRYPVPAGLIKSGKKNVLAVRVYDSQLSGGILSGDISLVALETVNLVKNLDGYWKFKTGDDLKWKEKDFADKGWDSIFVPSKWEIEGYANYDGFAWYRKSFYLSKNLKNEKLVLLLGKIDDIDQCYLNGKLIGSTGDFINTPKDNNFNNEWLAQRGYYIHENLLNFGRENEIAVRVYDGMRDGGIYQGPIGITTQKDYSEYWREKKEKKGFWDIFFNR